MNKMKITELITNNLLIDLFLELVNSKANKFAILTFEKCVVGNTCPRLKLAQHILYTHFPIRK